MRFISEDFKFEGMRKAQDFVIYPCKATDDLVTIQSDTRIAAVCFSTGTITISAPKSGGAHYAHLNGVMGAKTFKLSEADLERIRGMRDRMAGKTNADGSITIVG